MANLLVFLEYNNDGLTAISRQAVNASFEIKAKWNLSKIIGVCLGQGAEHGARDALIHGLDLVLFSEQDIFREYRAIPYAHAVAKIFDKENCDVLVGASSSVTKDFFPRVTVMVDAGQASDVIAINADGSLTRTMFAGDVLVDIDITSPHKVVTVRGSHFKDTIKCGSHGDLQSIEFEIHMEKAGVITGHEVTGTEGPNLINAEVVVSGGRGLDSSENFERLILPLAKVMDAAVGASRGAVDAGFATHDRQVGQTGKIISPKLYIAVGISGAVQHLAGMKDAEVIVAINQNDNAPILEIANYSLVADLHEAVPVLISEIAKYKMSGKSMSS